MSFELRKLYTICTLCFPYICPVSLRYIMLFVHNGVLDSIYLHVLASSLSLNICIVFCYTHLMVKYILQLFLVFTCSFGTSQLQYIPSLWVQFCFSFFRSMASVLYNQFINSFLSSLSYVFVINFCNFL